MEVTPGLILAMWSAGLAAGAALVSYWAIVGPGYGWLSAAVVTGVGGLTAFAGTSAAGLAGAGLALVAGIGARNRRGAAALFALSALAFLLMAAGDSGLVAVLSGTALMGGMTSVMLLGHWFLIDPQLPRWALQRLTLVGGVGLGADVAVVGFLGAFGGQDGALLAAMVALVVLTGLLIAGVWFSLQEQGYSGVMAATGLSYLGVLSAFGVVVVGRLLVTGL